MISVLCVLQKAYWGHEKPHMRYKMIDHVPSLSCNWQASVLWCVLILCPIVSLIFSETGTSVRLMLHNKNNMYACSHEITLYMYVYITCLVCYVYIWYTYIYYIINYILYNIYYIIYHILYIIYHILYIIYYMFCIIGYILYIIYNIYYICYIISYNI